MANSKLIRRTALLRLHAAVFLFGFTAILADLISLDAGSLVWWRLLLTCGSLLLLPGVYAALQKLPRKEWRSIGGTGILVMAHWVTFFASVKLANVSVALVCYSTTALFTALMAPLFGQGAWKRQDLLLGVTVVGGMVLVVEGIELSMMLGFWLGILSAVFIALFTLLNKRFLEEHSPKVLTFVELVSGWCALTLFLPLLDFGVDWSLHWWPSSWDWIYLLVLALLCTTLGFVLQLKALQILTPFASNLAMNLEPIYGIVLAHLLLSEGVELGWQFYLGVAVILVAVIIHPWLLENRQNAVS
ncbi:MAG: DMT family transporter [Saprospiraceae bacterium]|nr:DMT family transporter [Saprospiraceae bacterium]